MNFKSNMYPLWTAASLVMLLAFSSARAQVDHEIVDDDYLETSVTAQADVLLGADEIADLVGPIALYPDDLISIILPAATYPVQIVQAARFLQDREGNPDLAPPGDWDDAVVALLNYPEVIEMMNDDLDWTWALGEAFLNQQSEVLSAVADFRDQAYAAGNLRSDEHQIVTRTERVIEIVPADPEVIYVPYYEPARVVIYQPYPVYHYHPYPRYSYYYPYPAHYSFSYGYFFGVSTAYRLHWANHGLYTYNYGYFGHPYFGRSYYHRHYYRHRPYRGNRRHARSQGGYVNGGHKGDRWRPRKRHGPRPKARAERRAAGAVASNAGRRDRRTNINGRKSGNARANFAASGSNPRQRAESRRIYSDKNPDQRRTVQRYRDQAKASEVGRTSAHAGARPSRLARTAPGNAAASANRQSARQSARSVRPDTPAAVSRRTRLAASENPRDISVRTRSRHSNDSALRDRQENRRDVIVNMQRRSQSARPAARPQITRPAERNQSAPQRRPAQRPAVRAPIEPRQPKSMPNRARQTRSEQKSAPARSKQRANGGRRSEPRRR